MGAATASKTISIHPLALDDPQGQRISEMLKGLPTLSQLVEGDNGAAILGELAQLLGSDARGNSDKRAARFHREQVVRVQAEGRLLEEIGIVRDFSATGARVSFQRSASFDAIQHDLLSLKLRLPSKPEQVVSVEARLVRLAANDAQEVQLAFRFTDNQQDPYFETLLHEIEERNQPS